MCNEVQLELVCLRSNERQSRCDQTEIRQMDGRRTLTGTDVMKETSHLSVATLCDLVEREPVREFSQRVDLLLRLLHTERRQKRRETRYTSRLQSLTNPFAKMKQMVVEDDSGRDCGAHRELHTRQRRLELLIAVESAVPHLPNRCGGHRRRHTG